jgi:hypothetical protein
MIQFTNTASHTADEVWNFGRGDGVEKAILFANYLYNEKKNNELDLVVDTTKVTLKSTYEKYSFRSSKNMVMQMNLLGYLR